MRLYSRTALRLHAKTVFLVFWLVVQQGVAAGGGGSLVGAMVLSPPVLRLLQPLLASGRYSLENVSSGDVNHSVEDRFTLLVQYCSTTLHCAQHRSAATPKRPAYMRASRRRAASRSADRRIRFAGHVSFNAARPSCPPEIILAEGDEAWSVRARPPALPSMWRLYVLLCTAATIATKQGLMSTRPWASSAGGCLA